MATSSRSASVRTETAPASHPRESVAPRTLSIEAGVRSITGVRERVPVARSALVAVTGIDASGKGHVSRLIEATLSAQGVRVAVITVDGWLNLPDVRFSRIDPPGHFYRHAVRFEEMFERLVFPLRDHRSIRLEADTTEETARAYRRSLYEFSGVDVIVLDGIFLLKREFQQHYDASFWVDCSFETALERAIGRAQEGLSPEQTSRAYRTIYFPAQEIHLAIDRPRQAATAVLANDPRRRR